MTESATLIGPCGIYCCEGEGYTCKDNPAALFKGRLKLNVRH